MRLNQVELATDGDSSLMGHCWGLVARNFAKVSTLINLHCIAQRETLIVGHAFGVFLEFQMLNRFAYKGYEWVGCSTHRCNKGETIVKGCI
jgi:hypothetical protein